MTPENGKVAATIVLHVCNNMYALSLILDYPGVDLEGLNRHRVTPLAAQVRADHVDMVEELIRAGAKVAPNNNNNNTPLHLAVEEELRSVARVLLEYKADPHKKAYDGITPLAMGSSTLDQLDDALLSYNAEVEEIPTSSTEWHGFEERMEYLIGKVRRLKRQAIEAEAEVRRRQREQRAADGKSTVVLMPCRHMCVCTRCSDRLGSECPLCRDHIKERLKVFT
ncbi:conserved hypothetical protein [Perkinsus marinus ATCC 50983]|uniref:Uncharacterized protein n=1 Tax=Perkinsus marinus (strain ATCC 50983 / TXsc) TaxID=423536 RepID=C5KTJ1_PERM5|nr:conserved hypothetical protein [Perkinsus marinus ATCC 50983]EER12170.1 conserved hypothetical protein [Perkinsus marinus ATCC 50983]|eukprot:XP_002780375.1 conserved hypothetical protein [Perkinsus marinus ATCC 50983]